MVLFSINLRGRKLIKKIFALLLLTFLIILPAFSQEDAEIEDDYAGITAYGVGEQVFALNAGAVFPLFNIAPFNTDGDAVTALSGLKIGIAGSLKWGSFIKDNLSLGVELAGMSAKTDNRRLTMIPISFVTTYYFISYPFEFPIYINAGFSLNTLDEYFRVTPSIKPGAGAYYNINGEWTVGLNLDYWFMPEIYFTDALAEQSRIANFLQLSFSGVYHF